MGQSFDIISRRNKSKNFDRSETLGSRIYMAITETRNIGSYCLDIIREQREVLSIFVPDNTLALAKC